MDLLQTIYKRRSIRKYTDKKIDRRDILKIIGAGIQAPSACDKQAWKFIIIDNKRIMQKIVDKGAASFIAKAPLGILVLYNNQTDNIEYKDHLLSASACIQNMLLTAHSLGIGCCWVCHLPQKDQLRRMFNIPKYYDPVAYISMGYYKEVPKQRRRRYELKELISYNKFNFNEKSKSADNIKLAAKRLCRKIYFLIPYRKHIKKYVDNKFEKRFD